MESQKKSLRPYQKEAFDAVVQGVLAKIIKMLIVMASGLGKTVVAAKLIRWWLETYKGRVLFLAHMTEALDQARRATILELEGTGFTTGIRTGDCIENVTANVLFASFLAMRNDLESYGSNDFDFVIVDEAHHGQADRFREVIEFFVPAVLLGLTATPERMDRRDIREIFGEAVYTYDLLQALADREWLAEVDYRIKIDDLNKAALRKISEQVAGGDRTITKAQIDRQIFVEERTDAIVEAIKKTQDGKLRTVVFCPSIDHLEHFRLFYPEARAYHSGLGKKHNRETLRQFRRGEFLTLLTVDMLNEAIDVPEIEYIVFLRSTNSKRIWQQQLGRGLRKLLHQPGKKVIVDDYVVNCDRILMVQEFIHHAEEGTRKTNQTCTTVSSGLQFTFDTQVEDILLILERVKSDYYPTFKEASAAAQRLVPRPLTEASYRMVYKQDPRLRSNPRPIYAEFKQKNAWAIFLGTKYETFEEASSAAQRLVPRPMTEHSYRTVYRQDPLLPANPSRYYADFKEKGGTTVFLGTNTYETYEKASFAAQRLEPRPLTKSSYYKTYKQDIHLNSSPDRYYPNFREKGGWPAFLGVRRKGSRMVPADKN